MADPMTDEQVAEILRTATIGRGALLARLVHEAQTDHPDHECPVVLWDRRVVDAAALKKAVGAVWFRGVRQLAAEVRRLRGELDEARNERDLYREQRDRARMAVDRADKLAHAADDSDVDANELADAVADVAHLCPGCWRLHGRWCHPYGGPLANPTPPPANACADHVKSEDDHG